MLPFLKQSFILATIQLTFIQLASSITFPPPFSDNFLPISQRNGDFVEHLGRLIKLNTYMNHKRVEQIPAKFSIYNRRKSVEDIDFTPSKFCYANSCAYYQFDLQKLADSGFDPTLKTVILISGFLTSDNVDWMELTKNLWLQLEDVNLILISWKRGNRYVYSSVVANTPLIARQVTIFLHYLAQLNGIHLLDENFTKRIHFIGHSLGAHVAGFVGQDLGGKMGRITGLDPAGPSFDQMEREHRLDRGDARLVDVIHTNSGQLHYANAVSSGLLKGANTFIKKLPILGNLVSTLEARNYTFEGDTAWFGIEQQVGHLDFYANNGRVQPGCSDLLHVCDHGRSHEIINDILFYELEIRKYISTQNRDNQKAVQKQYRMKAFQTSDYESFLTGNNFNINCPSLLEESVTPNFTLKTCSIPLDLLTPAEELINELKNDFNLNVAENLQKFFFKTLSTRPLMADHYLLKVHLGLQSTWDLGCSLDIQLIMSNGLTTRIGLNKEIMAVNKGNFFGVAMPFVHVNGIEARAALDNIFKTIEIDVNGTRKIRGLEASLVYKVVPVEIKFEIKDAKPTGFGEATKSKLKSLIGFGKQASEKCRLAFNLVEFKPLIDFENDFVSLYSRMKFPGTNPKVKAYNDNESKNYLKTRISMTSGILSGGDKNVLVFNIDMLLI